MIIVTWAVRAVLALCALAAAGILIPYPGTRSASTDVKTRTLHVIAGPIHTDIVIPIDARIADRFSFLSAGNVPVDQPGSRWLIIGWGGRSFYTETPRWSDLKPIPVLKSLTIDRSVLHIDVAGDWVGEAPPLRSFRVDEAGYERLLSFVEGSFDRQHGQPVALTGAGYGASDGFFEASGWFNMFVGCNTWTAQALRSAGIATGWWTPLPASLFWSLDLHNRGRGNAGSH